MTDSNEDGADRSLPDVPWRRVASIVGLVLLIAVVLPFVVFSVPQVVGADHSYVVLSGSMEPVMSPGDATIVDSVGASSIEQGDIITFGQGGEARPTTHRVIEVVDQDGSPAFRTKGDANEDPDQSLVSPDQVQGRLLSIGGYLFVIPLIGYVINFANTPVGFAALFVLPIALLALNEIWKFIAATRSDPDAEDADESETEEAAGSGENAAAAETTGDEGGSSSEAVEPGMDTEPDGEQGDRDGSESSETAEAGITFSAAELQLGVVVLAAFLAYSVWVGYATREIWAFGVAGGVAAAFLLLTGLYLFGGSGDDTASEGAETVSSDSGPTSESESGSSSESAPASASEPVATDGEGDREGDRHVGDLDDDLELNLLEQRVAQPTDGDAGSTHTADTRGSADDGSIPAEDDENAALEDRGSPPAPDATHDGGQTDD